jgi:hypothetical protein
LDIHDDIRHWRIVCTELSDNDDLTVGDINVSSTNIHTICSIVFGVNMGATLSVGFVHFSEMHHNSIRMHMRVITLSVAPFAVSGR